MIDRQLDRSANRSVLWFSKVYCSPFFLERHGSAETQGVGHDGRDVRVVGRERARPHRRMKQNIYRMGIRGFFEMRV